MRQGAFLGMGRLPSEAMESLELPIMDSEWTQALRDSQTLCSPGPDVLPLSYYKLFNTLSSHFLSAFNAILEGQVMPGDTLRAHITVIPKEGKGPSHYQNYRPISMLNVNLKLFSKTLASRFSPFSLDIIHKDQVGFMPTCEACGNTTLAINLIYHTTSSSLPMSPVSTDTKKP